MISLAREILHRILSVFSKRQRDEEFEAELQAHIELAVLDNIEHGMAPKEARRRALVSLGGVEPAKELHRDSRGLPLIETLLRDLRLALRTLRREAGLTTFVVLIVGLGVGASTTVFSVAGALFLRPLPFEDPGRLVWIANGDSSNLSSQTVQVGNLLDFRQRTQTLSDVAGYFSFYGAGDIQLSGSAEPLRLTGVPVTGNFFRLLGTSPFLGRDFSAEEPSSGAPSVILSYRLWQRQFGSDHGAVGSSVLLAGSLATIIGVLPESFDFAAIFTPGKSADLFTFYPLSPDNDRQGNTLSLIGRLAPGIDLPSAQSEASLIAEQIASDHPQERRNDFDPQLRGLRDRVSGEIRQTLLILVGGVGLLMLIVCANLSNLLLVRARTRQREMAVRIALGAGRWRLIRQLLIESTVLACCGALLGLALAIAATAFVAQIEGTNIPLLHDVRVEATALGFTLLLTAVTGILFGLAPALQASAAAPAQALRESGRNSTAGRGSGWMRSALVVSEIALTCVLLTTVGLLIRSLTQVLDVELGFETENVVTLRVDPARDDLDTQEKLAYFDDLLAAARSVAGVEALGLTDALPLGDNFGWRTWDASTLAEEKTFFPMVRVVSEGYFSAMKVSLLMGNFFTQSDNASADRVAIVNQALADRLWPNQEAVDQSLRTNGHAYRVVGVVKEARYFALEREAGTELYLPIRQMPSYNSVDLVVRARTSLTAVIPPLRQALRSVDPDLPTTQFRTMQELVDKSTFSRRSVVLLLSGFAAFALILASLGVYATISYSVSQRRQEMGVRMALGATPRDLLHTVLRQAAKLASIGLALGAVASWLVAKALGGLLYGVSAADLPTYAAVLVLLAAFIAVASYVPARQTTRLDVVEALSAD